MHAACSGRLADHARPTHAHFVAAPGFEMDPSGAFSIRTYEPADFDQVCNLYVDGMNYYSQANGYDGMRGTVRVRAVLPLGALGSD